VDPVPDPLLLRKSGSAENRTRTSGLAAGTLTTRPQRWSSRTLIAAENKVHISIVMVKLRLPACEIGPFTGVNENRVRAKGRWCLFYVTRRKRDKRERRCVRAGRDCRSISISVMTRRRDGVAEHSSRKYRRTSSATATLYVVTSKFP
jgi:hypothetical protein